MTKTDIANIIPNLFEVLPKDKYQATLKSLLVNNPDLKKTPPPLNKKLNDIQDLEWNYAIVVKTNPTHADFVVYFVRNIYNQLYSKPFDLNHAKLNLHELLLESESKFSIAPLTKVKLTSTTDVYYLPKKRRLSSLPEDCVQEISTRLTLKEFYILSQVCKSLHHKTADIITTGFLTGELKEDFIHTVLSKDNVALLKKFPKLLDTSNLASLMNKYWNAFKCWNYLYSEKNIIQKDFIYQHYPLGKALFACIIGYKVNTSNEWYIEGYNLLYKVKLPLNASNPNFFELETKLKKFIQKVDLKIDHFPYNYNMIDLESDTVYCKGLPEKQFTTGLSYYDIVTKARYYFNNRVQPYLSRNMLLFLFERGLPYLPNQICKTSNKKLRKPSKNTPVPYSSDRLIMLLNDYSDEETPFLRFNITPDAITPASSNNRNIFNKIEDFSHIGDYYNSFLEDITRLTDEANKHIEDD